MRESHSQKGCASLKMGQVSIPDGTPLSHEGYPELGPPARKEGHQREQAPQGTKSEMLKPKPETPSREDRRAPTPKRPPTTRALVMHTAPLKYKPGTMRRWVKEDNRGVKIVGIWWLLREDRRGQETSSLVIYMRDPVEAWGLRMGRRQFRTTVYGWGR